jgi:hypothetical protein
LNSLNVRSHSALVAAFIAVSILATLAVGTILAGSAPTLSLIAKAGPRDNGVGVATRVRAVGDLAPGGVTIMGGPYIYWDFHDAAHEFSPIGSPDIENENGHFDFEFEIPWSSGLASAQVTRPGQHTVFVCGLFTAFDPAEECASARFTVRAPKISLSRDSGKPGESFTVNGQGFSPGPLNEAIWVRFGTEDLGLFGPGDSTFGYQVNVPDLPPGQYKVRACNKPNSTDAIVCAPRDIASADFTITSPKVIVAPASGQQGSAVKISGSNFFANQPIKLFFFPASREMLPGDEILPGKTTNSDGVFGPFNFTPNSGAGDYLVHACTLQRVLNCNSSDSATTAYTILAATPSPTASPTPTPTLTPSVTPEISQAPTVAPTVAPTLEPTPAPTAQLTAPPTAPPTAAPTAEATQPPTLAPTQEPTAPPTASPTLSPTPTPVAVTWPEHLASPGGRGGFDPTMVGTSFLLALLIAFLLPFPGTLFNKTVEANYSEIQGWFAWLRGRWNGLLDRLAIGPFGAVRRGIGRALMGRFGVLVFLALTALIYGFLSPTFGLDANSLALFLGLLVGLALITAAFDLPLRIYHGRRSQKHDAGVLRALWWTLLVALICVVVSRLAGFQPGYLYGLIVSIVFVTEISLRDEGIGTWLASLWLLVLSVVAWIALVFVRQTSLDPWVGLFVQTVLVTFVVAGIEALAIGLLPMRFLPGHPLYRWRKSMWFPLMVLAIFGYLLILVDPANGYLSDDSRTPAIVGIIFLVTFGAVSLGTWAYFRFRPSRGGASGTPREVGV